MIEYLKPVMIKEDETATIKIGPSNIELMNKINEIITSVNRLEAEFQSLANHFTRGR